MLPAPVLVSIANWRPVFPLSPDLSIVIGKFVSTSKGTGDRDPSAPSAARMLRFRLAAFVVSVTFVAFVVAASSFSSALPGSGA